MKMPKIKPILQVYMEYGNMELNPKFTKSYKEFAKFHYFSPFLRDLIVNFN
jgi:hypothetical protein